MNSELLADCLNTVYSDTPRMVKIKPEDLYKYINNTDVELYIKHKPKKRLERIIFIGYGDYYCFSKRGMIPSRVISFIPYRAELKFPALPDGIKDEIYDYCGGTMPYTLHLQLYQYFMSPSFAGRGVGYSISEYYINSTAMFEI